MNTNMNNELFKSIDESMQDGYTHLDACDIEKTASAWSSTYTKIRQLAEDMKIKDVKEFDKEFDGTQFVFNWIQDYGDFLEENIGETLEIPLETTLGFFHWAVGFQGPDNDHTRKSLKGQSAVCMIRGGSPQAGDEEFQKLIEMHPDFIWYPIWWADEYYFIKNSPNYDIDKAIEILENAVTLKFDKDKDVLYERLIETYKIKGSKDDMERVKELLDSWITEYKKRDSSPGTEDFKSLLKREPPAEPAPKEKIGRNDPCPCGSGKKYKKCCGKVV